MKILFWNFKISKKYPNLQANFKELSQNLVQTHSLKSTLLILLFLTLHKIGSNNKAPKAKSKNQFKKKMKNVSMKKFSLNCRERLPLRHNFTFREKILSMNKKKWKLKKLVSALRIRVLIWKKWKKSNKRRREEWSKKNKEKKEKKNKELKEKKSKD